MTLFNISCDPNGDNYIILDQIVNVGCLSDDETFSISIRMMCEDTKTLDFFLDSRFHTIEKGKNLYAKLIQAIKDIKLDIKII